MKKLLIALVFAGFSLSTFAQTADYPVREKSVETNSFWSNWFLSFGAGFQGVAAQRADNVGFFDTMSPDFTLSLGKWYTPGLGLRIQGTLPFYEDGNGDRHNGGGIYAQAMFNLSNMIGGYKEDRVYNFIPLVGWGCIFSDEISKFADWSPFNIGLLQSIRLSEAWNFNVELFWKQYNVIYNDHRTWQVGASVGVTYNFKSRKFVASPDMPALTALHETEVENLNEAVAARDQENEALKEQLAQKPKEIIKEKIVKEILAAPQSVFFSFNSSKIASKKEILNLESLANMAKNNNAKLKVTGYADSATGPAEYNQQLSERRAQAVAKELIKMGVSESNIVIEGKGGVSDIKPASYNRRVIIEAL